MTFERDWSTRQIATLIGSLSVMTLLPGAGWVAAVAQTAYPDVSDDLWAQPYIQQLSQADILAGYPDGTFRPLQPMARDEYAAVIRQAFDLDPEESLPQASVFQDVPQDYWANAAIEEAYEMGFMDTQSENEFNPRTPITRIEAIVALVDGLELSADPPATANVPAAAETEQPVRQARSAPSRLMFPLAATSVMQLFAPPQVTPAQAPAPAEPTAAQPTNAAAEPMLSDYYADAGQIPEAARDHVAIATQAGLIVNYPDQDMLNPNQPMTRASVAALMHQALVYQDKLEPLPADTGVSQYQVEPEATP